MRGKNGIGIICNMEENEDLIEEPKEKANEEDPDRLRDRFERAIRGLEKPKSKIISPNFHNITIKERGEKLLAVELLAQEYLSPEQIFDFLPAWGMSIPLSRIYNYLSMIQLPKQYRLKVERRRARAHDILAVNHLTRLAKD